MAKTNAAIAIVLLLVTLPALVFWQVIEKFAQPTSIPVVTAPQKVPTANTRKVFAHYMLALTTYGESIAAYKREIQEAQAAGIDGFALNAGAWSKEAHYPRRAALMFQAAKSLGTGFKLFFSADLCCSLSSADIRDMMTTYARHPNYFLTRGQPMLSTFAGEGQGRDWWLNEVLTPLRARGINVFFIPYFYPRPATETPDYNLLVNNFNGWWKDVADGMFYFGAAGLPFDNPSLKVSNEAYARLMREDGRPFMASYSPLYWGMNQKVTERRYYEFEGGKGTDAQWLSIINVQQPEWVQIVTWNDFGESYMSPVDDPAKHDGSLKNRKGFYKSHRGFYELNKYYIKWYKTGIKPALTKDTIFYFYRTHSKDAVAKNDPDGAVSQLWGNVQDNLYITTMLTKAAVLKVLTGDRVYKYPVKQGIQHVSVPFRVGIQSFELWRDDVKVISLKGESISNSIKLYNFFYTTGFAYSKDTSSKSN